MPFQKQQTNKKAEKPERDQKNIETRRLFSVSVKLSKRLRAAEEPQYEALCHLAVARCEQSVGHAEAEAEALIKASRSFLDAEMKTKDVGCPSYEEHLMAGKSILSHLSYENDCSSL